MSTLSRKSNKRNTGCKKNKTSSSQKMKKEKRKKKKMKRTFQIGGTCYLHTKHLKSK